MVSGKIAEKTLFMRSGEKKARYNNLINAKTNPIRNAQKIIGHCTFFFVFGNGAAVKRTNDLNDVMKAKTTTTPTMENDKTR